jgi:hypothetical protein
MTARVIQVEDVNEALWWLIRHSGWQYWPNVSPRGMPTLEHDGPLITDYHKPVQRVLFDPTRDANPFFHFFEALWILNGDDDVAFLKFFNGNIAKYSDDGERFHAPYGYRLRKFFAMDQLLKSVSMLRHEPATRQVVLQIWDCLSDLGTKTRDMPCNDLIFLKMRDGKLNMSVLCRSNDAVWGAYGANAVQFSTLQEWVAGAVGAEVGVYRQFSDSLHLYLDDESGKVWKRLQEANVDFDPYRTHCVRPYPLWTGWDSSPQAWLNELACFMSCARIDMTSESKPITLRLNVPYLRDVALPLWKAWRHWKNVGTVWNTRNERINAAQEELLACEASDWKLAAMQWLERRRELQTS